MGVPPVAERNEFKLGTFYPAVNLNNDQIAEWQSRNVLNIPECQDCQHNIICGGGCGVVAAHKNGSVLSPDCRPIQALVDLGVNYYIDEINTMATPEPVFTSGCILCGAKLVYKNQSTKAKCEYCGQQNETSVVCQNGHYVCEDCHRKDILDLVEQVCLQTNLTDPIELAMKIFELPGLNMHGLEYHSIVPAIIVAIFGNNTGNKNAEDIHTAIERGKAIKGGVCGTHGACGAAIGIGIAFAIMNQVSPLSKDLRGEANRLTAEALLAMSEYGGPRCCKRETITTLEVAKRLIPHIEKGPTYRYQCQQYPNNKDCIHHECPYFYNRIEIKDGPNLAIAN